MPAIAAHDAGAHVIIVEPARRGGGNARDSGGFLCDLPSATAVRHLDALCFGRTDISGWFAFRCAECFLASDGAAALTGQTLCIDGGLVMR